MIRLFPFIFILLWSSAFITTKPIIDNSDPFSALSFRFFIVALGFFIFSILTKKNIVGQKKHLIQSIFSGVLFHGFYLGGVFFSVSRGLPTGIAALIVTLQPILTNAFAGPVLKEKANNILIETYKITNGQIPIIGVGGISTGEDAYQRIKNGANLIQIYTSFIMDGPDIVYEINRDLHKLLKEDGYNNISEAVGKNHT